MAPRGKRGDTSSPQAFHELGVRGRKTGAFLKDTGVRDEHGMQPLDDLLSSPQKAPTPRQRDDDDDSGSEDMDIASSAGPGPRTLLKNRPQLLPMPRSRSPAKTNLQSPARRNPLLDRFSSPTRGSISEDREPTVTRKLDFGGRKGRTNGVNGTVHEEDEEEEEEEIDNMELLEESMQMVNDMSGSSPQREDFPVQEESVIQRSATKSRRGRPKAAPKVIVSSPPPEEPIPSDEEPEEEEPAPRPKPRGRPPKKDAPAKPAVASSRKRGAVRASPDDQSDEDEDIAPVTKRQRTQAKASKPQLARTSKPEPKPRGKPGRKPKTADSGDVGETSFAALQRGPPMPKSRGLVSVRRDPDEVVQTRSGRHSYRPLNWWKGEQVVMEEEEQDDAFARNRFVMPTIKEIIRVPEEEPQSRRGARAKPGRKGKGVARRAAPEEELEEWEVHPGTVAGEVVLWEPEHELHPPAEDEPVQIAEEQIALSAAAVETKDIRDATFRFAKTLTMPFMGAGIVDLPPGAEKRPKNSRKMHMVFFVHYGKVLVTVNEAQFRITAGGMWFVPRGNYYSITNDYDVPSRIFFSQACEISSALADQSQTSMIGY